MYLLVTCSTVCVKSGHWVTNRMYWFIHLLKGTMYHDRFMDDMQVSRMHFSSDNTTLNYKHKITLITKPPVKQLFRKWWLVGPFYSHLADKYADVQLHTHSHTPTHPHTLSLTVYLATMQMTAHYFTFTRKQTKLLPWCWFSRSQSPASMTHVKM